MKNDQHVLVGRTINEIRMTDDKLEICFILNDGNVVHGRCDADCCSYTWIEHVEDPEAIVGSPVYWARDKGDMPDDDMSSGECIAFYGFEIATGKGRCVIDYRNESNGYYGGWMHWSSSLDVDVDASFEGGVYGQQKHGDKIKWNVIASVNEG